MKLSEYFEKTKGKGSSPLRIQRKSWQPLSMPGLISSMRRQWPSSWQTGLTHKNLESNPHAAYLFMESGERYAGKRLYLTRSKKKRTVHSLIRSVEKRVARLTKATKRGLRYLVYFKVKRYCL